MSQRRRGGKPLKRSTGKRRELRTIVVFCEGEKSEPGYVNGLKRLPHVMASTALNLEIHPEQGAPITLVRMAVERKKDPEVDEPCFELRLILHHRDYSRFDNTDVVERASRALEGRKGKGIDAGFYMPLREEAVRRAVLLDERHASAGVTSPHDNPSRACTGFSRRWKGRRAEPEMGQPGVPDRGVPAHRACSGPVRRRG